MARMDQKVQLRHPHGKKAVTMSREKYDLLKASVLAYLQTKGKASFSELLKAVAADIRSSKAKFLGSLPWHMEWVKLDLEARRMIRRVPETSPQQYVIVRKARRKGP